MSLKVWLPLNGDLENKGASNVNITANGATVNTSGKIGSCYSFDGSDDYISLDGSIFYDIIKGGTQPFSIAMWIYHNDSTRAILFGDYSLSGAINFNIELTTAHQVRFYWNGSPDKNFDSNSSVGLQTWTHIVLTYDGSQLLLYKNGTIISDKYSGALAAKAKSSGVYYLGRDSRTGTTALNGRLNDFRIYDHCLSAAEVKEISQALVLHYKLNDAVGFTDIIQNQNTYIVYNNYGSSGTTGTLTNLNETFDGNVVRREVMTPNDTSVGNFRTSLGSHGVYGHRQTFLANTKYVFWIYYRPVSHMDIRVGGTASNIGGWTEIPPIAIGNGWYRVGQYRNGSVTEDKTDNIFTSFYTPSAASGVPITIDWASPHLLAGTTEIPPYNYPSNIIQDSSGYNYNGTIVGQPKFSKQSLRYNYSTSFDGVSDCIIVPYNQVCPENIFTINLWFKKDEWGTKGYETLFGGPSGFEMDTRSGTNQSLQLNMVSTRSGKRNLVTEMSLGEWYMITMTRDGVTEKYYVNGIFQSEIEAKAMPTGTYRIGAWASNTGQNYYGYINDFRIYATPLLDSDIKSLYNVGMKIDNQQQIHTFEGFEQLSNIMYKPNLAIGAQEWKDGLNRYQQSNCQVSLTENGVHVYRPANLSQANDGNTMYGGIKIVNSATDSVHAYDASIDNIFNLQKNHTYVWIFYVKGNTTNAPSFQVSNNMGWGGGGLTPSSSNVVTKNIPTNFDGETEVWYKFTISDDIVKTCTSSYSSFVANTQYLSYKHFGWNWSYATTGNGTDIYVTNIRLYDITDIPIGKLTKTGITKFSSIFEVNDSIHITKNEDLIVNQFIER